MGNSCMRESEIVQSDRGVSLATERDKQDRQQRGRWSAQGNGGSVDLDTLLEAPSPVSVGRRRRTRSNFNLHPAPTSAPLPGAFGDRSMTWWGRRTHHGRRAKDRKERKRDKRTSCKGTSSSISRWKPSAWRQSKSTLNEEESEHSAYRSYEDPGCMNHDRIDFMHLDSDLILQSPPESPPVIHARWGEPVDDPEEKATCSEFQANPFKLGFCINCQKQHDVNDEGNVASKKEYTKIARPVVSKTAANALDNPNAVMNRNSHRQSHESDVDLAGLLKQRREILMKLSKIDQEKTRQSHERVTQETKRAPYESSTRHSIYLADQGSLVNLRRVASAGRATMSGPISLRATRTSGALVSPRATPSFHSLSKRLSLATFDAEPVRNDWL